MSDTIPRHVFDVFLARLSAAFGEPVSPDPQRFMLEYARMLRNYAAAELSRAADHLLATHKGPQRWPRIADCIDAAETAREANQQRAKAQHAAPAEDWQTRTSDAERFMASTDMGIASAREGWANGMREFVVAHRRLPQPHEVHEIKRNADFIDRCAAGIIDMGVLHNELKDLAGRMIDRRNAIADRVIGEVGQ
jgi:hypothetical protein